MHVWTTPEQPINSCYMSHLLQDGNWIQHCRLVRVASISLLPSPYPIHTTALPGDTFYLTIELLFNTKSQMRPFVASINRYFSRCNAVHSWKIDTLFQRYDVSGRVEYFRRSSEADIHAFSAHFKSPDSLSHLLSLHVACILEDMPADYPRSE